MMVLALHVSKALQLHGILEHRECFVVNELRSGRQHEADVRGSARHVDKVVQSMHAHRMMSEGDNLPVEVDQDVVAMPPPTHRTVMPGLEV